MVVGTNINFSWAVVFAVMIALAGCRQDDDISVRLPAYDPLVDDYRMTDVEITTLDDLRRLDGRATTLVGGAQIVLDYQKNEIDWKEAGAYVAFGAIKSDGVLIPEDFDSLAMASAYYGLELSMLFLEDVGMPRDLLVHMETYYWPDLKIIENDGEEMDMKDNAFYMYIAQNDRGFYIFPYEDFQWLPLSMNAGVMTHEYTHSVFDALVYDPNRGGVTAAMVSSGANFLYGLNEGCADSMAVARTGDPDYMEHSIEKNVYVVQCNTAIREIVRDASVPWNYSPAIDSAARLQPTDDFCPYDVGAFFASLLYSLAQDIDQVGPGPDDIPSDEARAEVARALLGALDDLGQSLRTDFELYDMFSLLTARLSTQAQRDGFCALLELRYAMYYDLVEGC